MKSSVVLFIILLTPLAEAFAGRDLYLPPWHDQAAHQIFHLELAEVTVERIELEHPCTISLLRPVVVSNGVARATLLIDLRTTSSTFPLIFAARDAQGRRTIYEKLNCHLSLVPTPAQVHIQGDAFAVTNLTERPFEMERTENLTITSWSDRHILGNLSGVGLIKLRGLPSLSLNPKPKANRGKGK